MVEELKTEARKLTNLIGFKGKNDVTSRAFTLEMIRTLEEKYKEDLKSTVRLRRLEFYYDLIENARHKQRERVGAEENFVLSDAKEQKKVKKRKEHKGGDDEEEHDKVEAAGEDKDEGIRLEDEVEVKTEELDEWKNLMTLAKVYYLMEYPHSAGLAWKRRTKKRKSIKKFTDKDLIEWYVSQHFRLKGLEKWAQSYDHARKLAEESPYDFDDCSDDDESRELEDMFHVRESQKPKKRKLTELEKALHSKRHFKLKDETLQDWTESYSDDSEEPGAEKMFDRLDDFYEESDEKVEEFEPTHEEEPVDESDMLEIFSNYSEISKYRNPAFDEMDFAQNIDSWYELCDRTMGEVTPPSEEEEVEDLRKVSFGRGLSEPRVQFDVVVEESSFEEGGPQEEELSEKNGIYFSNDYSLAECEQKLAQQAEDELLEELVEKMTLFLERKDGEEVEAEEFFRDDVGAIDDESYGKPAEEEVQISRRYMVCGNWTDGSQFDAYKFLWEMGCILPIEESLDPNTDIVVAFPSTDVELARCVMPSYWSAVQVYLNDTPETCANMIEGAGASWVIIGQGERSIEIEENNTLIAEKVMQALYKGLRALVCLGELPEERATGMTLDVIFSTLHAIAGVTSDWTNIVLAYEPVGQSGTETEKVQYIHVELRNWLRENVSDYIANTTRIIYAGPVSSNNYKELAEQEDIDGFLVTSAQANDFKYIININVKG